MTRLEKCKLAIKKGIKYDKKNKKWISQIMIEGKNVILGRFNDKEKAINKYNSFKTSLINKITK